MVGHFSVVFGFSRILGKTVIDRLKIEARLYRTLNTGRKFQVRGKMLTLLMFLGRRRSAAFSVATFLFGRRCSPGCLFLTSAFGFLPPLLDISVSI